MVVGDVDHARRYSTAIPSAILYIPNTKNVCRATNDKSRSIVSRDTQNAAKAAIAKVIIAVAGSDTPVSDANCKNFASFKSDAPPMAGTAIKNENSVAAVRDTPASLEPITAEPEREVPGISDSA